jgi:hypothetical protein
MPKGDKKRKVENQIKEFAMKKINFAVIEISDSIQKMV